MAAVVLNGRKHDWVTVKVFLPSLGVKPLTCNAITYPKHGMAKEHVYGTGEGPIGHTRDSYKIDELTLEFLASEMDSIRSAMGPNYGKVEFPVSVSYIDTGLTARTDQFFGCHITGEQPTVSQGTDPARVQVTLKPDKMVLGGVPYIVEASA